MTLTINLLRAMLPKAPDDWLMAMIDNLPKHGIDTPNEIASFVAQIAHESDELTRLEENLNYSAGRMAQVWKRFSTNPGEKDLKKRIPNDLAYQYEKNPERLANFVYASRIGNGDEASGDGWRFHGRGPIQLTGRRNYAACGVDIKEGLLIAPELLLTPLVGIRSALWFWQIMNLDKVDDDDDIKLETRRINGGETGLAHRQRYFNHCMRILEAT